MNICIKYSYDGSKFYGFQRQNNLKTVQGEIEKVIKYCFKENVNLISSGRTDLGVHAISQVSNFNISNSSISLKSIKRALNTNLYGEIKVNEIFYVNDDFNSRYMAKKRTYMYRLKLEENISVFESAYITGIKKEIDIKEFLKISKPLIGIHDFSSFMKLNKDVKNYIREIYSINIEKIDDEYRVYITGNAFLHAMVRIITASILATLFKEVDSNYIEYKLKNLEIDKPKKIISPNGLYLYDVEY